MRVKLELIEDVTPRIKTFWFRPERGVRYVAGQFTEIHLPHQADDRGIRRWFTLSSSPTEPLLSITTRFDDLRSSSFKRALATLQPKSELNLADPMGDFVLPKDPTIPLVFVAGGLGITPVRSMVKWLHDTGQQRAIKLLYAVPQTEDLAFAPLFKNYDLQFTPHVKSKGAPRITAEHIKSIASDDALIFISGPEILVETLYKDLQKIGVNPDRLVCDYFPGYNHN